MNPFAAGVTLVALPYPSTRRPEHNPFLHDFARTLAAAAVPVEVVAPQRLPAAALGRPEEVVDGIRVHRPRHWSTGAFGPLRGPRTRLAHRTFQAAAVRVDERLPPPAFYWGHFLRPAGATAVELGRLRDRPAVVALDEGSAPATERFGAEANGEVLREAAAVVAVSSANAQRAADLGVDPDRIGHFPNRVDTDRFTPGDRAAARRALGLAADAFVAVFVGRFDERKGADRVVAALDRLGPGAVGLLLGRGRLQTVRHDDVVRAVDHGEMPVHLQAADVFVLPSHAEGSPNALVEAMACGLPVVVSDRPFMRELVDESAATFVDPGRVAEIADGLAGLRDDPARRAAMGAAARQQAAADSLADRTRRLLAWLAPRVGSPPG